jgi:hypothetical protein
MNGALVYVLGILLYSLFSANPMIYILTFSLVFPVAIYSLSSFPMLSKESCLCQCSTQQMLCHLKLTNLEVLPGFPCLQYGFLLLVLPTHK